MMHHASMEVGMWVGNIIPWTAWRTRVYEFLVYYAIWCSLVQYVANMASHCPATEKLSLAQIGVGKEFGLFPMQAENGDELSISDHLSDAYPVCCKCTLYIAFRPRMEIVGCSGQYLVSG